jgi:hypothetical protein
MRIRFAWSNINREVPMKNSMKKIKTALLLGSVALLALLIARPGYSQETVKKEPYKRVIIKTVTGKNGTTTTVDTVITLADSAHFDSALRDFEKVIILEKDGRHGRLKVRTMPGGYSYDFDMPEMADFQEGLEELKALEDLKEFEWESLPTRRGPGVAFREERLPGPGRHRMQFERRGETLNDILGDIPMDRVVNYSVKDRKNGKRIIIDVENAPMFEKREKVIIIREPGKDRRYKTKHPRTIKIHESPVKPVPPPPPPPPPPDEK